MSTVAYQSRTNPTSFNLMIFTIILIYFALSIVSFSTTSEDAYISYRYANNLAHGFGLVFNEGGEVVEGFSNPLWVFLLTGFSFLGINVGFAGRCLGLLFGALTLVEIILLFNVLNGKINTVGYIAALCIMTSPVALFWFQAGLENALYIYLIVLSLRLILIEDYDEEKFSWSWIPLVLVTMTRPEGVIYPVLAGLWKYDRMARIGKLSARNIYFIWIIIASFCILCFIVWRLLVFGEWLPNTFFAKVNNGMRYNFTHGFNYLLSGLKHTLWIPLILPVATILMTGSWINPDRRAFGILIGAFAMVYALFVMYAGGDIHPYDRFFLPFIIFSPLASFILVENDKNIGWVNSVLTFLCVGYIAGNLLYSSPPKWPTQPTVTRPANSLVVNASLLAQGLTTPSEVMSRYTHPVVDILEYVGRDLKDDPGVNGLLAVDQCGKIPFYYEGPVLDLLGLNDTEVARIVHSVSTWNDYAETILNKTPGAFVFVYTGNHPVSTYYLENTVMSAPFQDRYELSRIYHADNVFRMLDGTEYSFPLELLLYRSKNSGSPEPLTIDEHTWLIDHEPIVENPDGLADQVEAFRRRNPGGVVNVRVEYN